MDGSTKQSIKTSSTLLLYSTVYFDNSGSMTRTSTRFFGRRGEFGSKFMISMSASQFTSETLHLSWPLARRWRDREPSQHRIHSSHHLFISSDRNRNNAKSKRRCRGLKCHQSVERGRRPSGVWSCLVWVCILPPGLPGPSRSYTILGVIIFSFTSHVARRRSHSHSLIPNPTETPHGHPNLLL